MKDKTPVDLSQKVLEMRDLHRLDQTSAELNFEATDVLDYQAGLELTT
ncbi:MAG TPA: hypothetical protein VF532_07070 [Candidatus Angelobacter sp.]